MPRCLHRPTPLASITLLASALFTACTPQSTPPTSILLTPSAADTVSYTPEAIAPTLTATLPTSTNTPTATQPPTITATVSNPQFTPPLDLMPLTVYQIDAVFDYPEMIVEVTEEITYSNRTGEELHELVLVVEPAVYPGVLKISRIGLSDGSTISGWSLQKNLIRLNLPEPLAPGNQLHVQMDFTLRLPEHMETPDSRPIVFGYTRNQVNLVDWYAFIPPYIPGQGWLAHEPGILGEHTVYESSDFEVRLRFADGDSGLTIAASAPEEREPQWRIYRHSAARNFALTISHVVKTASEQVGPVTVTSMYFPVHEAAGQRALQTTVEALELYQELFGPYPHPSLTVVEADFLDGMEYDGLFFLSYGFYNLYAGKAGDYLTAIAAHETAHQWWYARVGNDQALEPWLDEALCTYSERIYYENYSAEGFEWWWDYRLNYYYPQGAIDQTIYDAQGTAEGYRSYRDAVYLNGAMFFEDLRSLVGDQDFFAFLADYASTYSYQLATKGDFFTLLAAHTSADTDRLVQKYFSLP